MNEPDAERAAVRGEIGHDASPREPAAPLGRQHGGGEAEPVGALAHHRPFLEEAHRRRHERWVVEAEQLEREPLGNAAARRGEDVHDAERSHVSSRMIAAAMTSTDHKCRAASAWAAYCARTAGSVTSCSTRRANA